MFGFGESHESWKQVYQGEREQHESSFSHELIAGAAAFEGFKAFEDHQRREGKTISHGTAKEILVGLAAAEVDKLAETKGMDAYDQQRAKHKAKKNAEEMYDSHYGQHEDYRPDRGMPRELGQYY